MILIFSGNGTYFWVQSGSVCALDASGGYDLPVDMAKITSFITLDMREICDGW